MSADPVASPTSASPDSFSSSPAEPVSRGFVESRGDPEDSRLLPSPSSSDPKSGGAWPPAYHKDAKEAMENALAAEPKFARFWRTFVFIIQATCTFVGSLLLNVQQVAIFPLRFIDMGLFRSVDELITRTYAPVMTMIFEKWSGVKLLFYGSQEFWQQKGPENAIMISNHASFSDWPVMYMIAERKGFATRLRILIKEVAKYVPGIGWGCWLHEMIFVRKNWTQDGPILAKKIADFRTTRSNIWIALFPEGTFVDDKSRHLVPESERFCVQKGIPVLRHVLVPRVKGFTVLCDALRGHVTHVVDLTMVFEGCQNPNFPQYNTYTTLGDLGRVLPEISAYLNGLPPSRIHVYIRTYPLDEVPAAPDQTERWLVERFQEKEQLLTYFHENGKFPGEPTQHPLSYPRLILHALFLVLLAFSIVFGISRLSAFALTVATAGGVIFLAAALLIQSRVHAE